MKVFRRKTRTRFIGAGVAILLILVCAGVYFVRKIDVSADDAGTGGYNNTSCGSGSVCHDEERLGVYWIRVPIPPGTKGKKVSEIANGVRGPLFGEPKQKYPDMFALLNNDREIKCEVGDYAYILTTVWFENGKHPYDGHHIVGLLGLVDMDEKGDYGNLSRETPRKLTYEGNAVVDPNNWVYGGKNWNPNKYQISEKIAGEIKGYIKDNGTSYGKIEVVDESTARAAFLDLANENGRLIVDGVEHRYDEFDHSGTGLGYFCGGSGEEKTESRIAVQNMTVDGAVNPQTNLLTAKSNRGTTNHNDTNWNDVTDAAWVLAKPGDSIRFYHGIQTTARNNNNATIKISAENANDRFKDNWPKDNGGKAKDSFAATITYDPQKDGKLKKYEFINPSVGYEGYRCIEQYSTGTPFTNGDWSGAFRSGGFQVPGFGGFEYLAKRCPGDNKNSYYIDNVKIASDVGRRIIQSHTFSQKSGGKSGTKKASVWVPYNFQTTVSLDPMYDKDKDKGYIYADESLQMEYKWHVDTRNNPTVSPDKPDYSTITPPGDGTKVITFQWVRVPGDPGSNGLKGNNNSSVGPQEYYKTGMVPDTYVSNTDTGSLNKEGRLYGSNYYSAQTSIMASDAYIGYELCTAIAVYPSNSHNGSDNSYNTQLNVAMHGGNTWNISNAVCRTIAKKPSFQVWNGSVYTEGKITTSTTDVGGRIHGSWTDYSLIAGKSNSGMASGAMFGYLGLNTTSLSGGMDRNSRDDSNKRAKKANQQTISNTGTTMGNSNINTSSSYRQTLSRLESRYKEKARALLTEERRSGRKAKIYSTKTGMQAAHISDDSSNVTKLSNLEVVYEPASNPNSDTLTNSADGFIKRLGDGVNDNTLVIFTSGTLVIDRNICYGNSCGSDATKLISYADGTKTKEAAKLPQILIFAKNIQIAENVTRIDAWLISEGTVNTCTGHTIGDLVARDVSGLNYTAGNCGLTLVVNGPVYAKHLDLLRTAGAYADYGSGWFVDTPLNTPFGTSTNTKNKTDADKLGRVSPAEIFNLRADTYIWAFNQAQRYNEAVVTYTRELAPRY